MNNVRIKKLYGLISEGYALFAASRSYHALILDAAD
jgi:hypothetical protein